MATQLDKVVFPTGDYIEDTNTDTKVTQTATSTNANYEVIFSGTADNTTRTEGVGKDSNLLYNPSSNTLEVKNTGVSNSITPSSISLSNSSGGGISIDNTNNKIEIGKSGTSITYSNTDVVTSNGNTWDGTNTSLKTSIVNAGKTKVIQGILRINSGFFDDDVLIPLDTVFELGYNYILEINADGDGGSSFYKGVILKFQLENVTVNDDTGGSGDHIIYHFSCVNSPESTMLKKIGDNAGKYYSYVNFSTLNGEPFETYTKDSVTYWESDSYIQQVSSNYALDEQCYLLNQNKLSLSGGTMTGAITAVADKWYTGGNYAMHLNNSDVVGVNGIWFADLADSKGEGIMFPRTNGNWDDLYSVDGALRYCVNRTTSGERSSYYTILHTGNGVASNGGTYTGGGKTAGKPMHGVGTGHAYACEWGSNLAFWVDITKVATVSDRRLKDDIEPINMNLVKSIAECPSYQYKAFNRNGLISVGIIAQDLVENCKKYGVDPLKYELIDKEIFIEGDDTLYYHIEYDQLLYFKTLYLEQKVKELEEKLNELT